jgi:lipopolysaccharide export system permease protein
MITLIDRYLARQIVTTTVAIIGIGVAIMLLERLLRLFALVANPDKALGYVAQMLVLLLPHYLTIALPAAFFFGVLLTFQRLRRDSELVVLSGAGQSFGRLMVPAIGLAVLTTLLAALIMSHLGPHARYAYRSLKHVVAQASLTAAVLEETFIQSDGLTFFAEDTLTAANGVRLGKVFVHEAREDGGSTVVTGRDGWLAQAGEDGDPVLVLREGVRAEMPAGVGVAGALVFRDLSWPVVTAEERYRPRGRDQRELTAVELWQAEPTATSKPSAAEVSAELHGRLVRVVSVLVLPLLAAPLGLIGGPRERRSGIVVGLLLLIVYHEAINLGESLAKRDLVAPAFGLWLPLAAMTAGTLYLFLRTAAGRPLWPLATSQRASPGKPLATPTGEPQRMRS